MKKKKYFLLMAGMMAGMMLLAGCQSGDTATEEAETSQVSEDQSEEAETAEGQDGQEDPESDAFPAATQDEIAAADFTSTLPGAAEEDEFSEDDIPKVLPSEDEGDEFAAEEKAPSVVLDTSSPLTGIHHAVIEVEDFGTVQVELDADQAPLTVTNFVKLAQEGFYDGLTFHRIVTNFMIQGGDPLGNGTGGSEETIKGEFKDNGVDNTISHTRGTISMARTDDPDSASSQFFIMHQNYNRLDGQYAAFGHVTEGMETVDAIVEYSDTVPKNAQTGILANKEDQPVISSIRITD